MCQLSFHCCSKTSSGTCHPVLRLCYFPEKEKTLISLHFQRAKKVVSNGPGLVDFAIAIVFFVLNLPDGQVLFFGEIQLTEGLLSILLIKKGFGAN